MPNLGGGPLAANLARHGHKVLLLEAGDDQGQNLNEKIPLFWPAASEDPTMRWDFFVKHYADEKQAAKDPKMYVILERPPIQCCLGSKCSGIVLSEAILTPPFCRTWETPEGAIFVGLNPPAGSKQKGIYYPRAGTLGGCASHNALVAILPHDSDWQHIVDITGDESWNPKQMRHYFEHLERCRYLPKGTPGHGFDGWLETEHSDPIMLESSEPILASAVAATGHHGRRVSKGPAQGLLPDINALHPQRVDGVYEMTLQMSKDARRSSPRNFLVATANAKNADGSKKYPLHIRTHSFATRVLFNENGHGHKPKAIGVEFLEGVSLYKADPRFDSRRAGIKKRVMASREVIVAGGAFNTPQILKLSGIGPKSEIEKFNIPVVVDLPGVGTNLQDNYEFSVVAQSPENFSPFTNSGFGIAGDQSLVQWNKGFGPYKSDGSAAGVLKHSTVSGGDEDLFLLAGPTAFTGFFPGYSRAALTSSSDFTLDILKVHPQNAAGTVKLRSKDPHDTPEINFNYFKENADHDLTAMTEGVELARKILDGVSKPIGPFTERDPGASVETVAEIKQAIKNQAFSHHASSTCAIGADDDPMACLDSRFRVRGVEGLRVVDASVFPRVPGSFPTLPIYMVSEKASECILEDVKLDDAILDAFLDVEILVEDAAEDRIVLQQGKQSNGKKRKANTSENGLGKKKNRSV
jgi:choline dehydrogenase